MIELYTEIKNKMKNELLDNSHREKEPQPGYFEWWYFHFVSTDGTTVNLVFHETDIFGLTSKPYMSLSLLKKGNTPIHYNQNMDNASLFGDSQKLKLNLQFQDKVAFEGEISNLAKSLIIEDGVLCKDSLGRTSNWAAEVPHALFEGILTEGREKIRIKGFAYQDHQWGTLPLQEFVSDWVWGHFSDEENSIIFFKILTQSGERVDRLGIVFRKGEARYTSSSCQTDYLENLSLVPQPDGVKLPGSVYLPKFATEVSFQIKPEQLMRRRVDENYDGFNASYLRWASEGFFLGRRLGGITEYLRIRK